MFGADPAILDAEAALFRQQAARLDGIAKLLTSHVHTAPWRGRQADRYRAHWDAVDRNRLTAAAASLRAGAIVLAANAAEQRNASGDQGSRAGSSLGHAPMVGLIRPFDALWARYLRGEIGTGPFIAALKGIINVAKFGPLANLLVSRTGAISYTVLKTVKETTALGVKVGTTKIGLLIPGLDIVAGVYGIYDSVHQFFFQKHPYQGSFNAAWDISRGYEFIAGGLAAAGGIMLFTPAAPIGLVLLAGSAGIGLVSLGIDSGLKAWNNWGGRDYWNHTLSPELHQTWHEASTAASNAWHDVNKVAGQGVKVLHDAGSALNKLERKAFSWL